MIRKYILISIAHLLINSITPSVTSGHKLQIITPSSLVADFPMEGPEGAKKGIVATQFVN